MYAKVRGFNGIACQVLGPVKVWEPMMVYLTDEDTGEEFETPDPDGDGEWIDGDGEIMRVVMVGDDRVHNVDSDDITPLKETEDGYPFCLECGQLGCFHGR